MGLEKRFTLVIQIVLFVPNSNLILYRGIQIVCLYQELKLFVCTGNNLLVWFNIHEPGGTSIQAKKMV